MSTDADRPIVPKHKILIAIGAAALLLVASYVGYRFATPKSDPAPPAPAKAATPATPTVVQGPIAAPEPRVGDSYTYETVDLADSNQKNVAVREVVDVKPDGFMMTFLDTKSGQSRRVSFDKDMNLVRIRAADDEGSDYSPALRYYKFPLKTGDTWSATSTETNIKTGKRRTQTVRGTIGDLESIVTPAGTFTAIRITLETELNEEGKTWTGRDVSWYSPVVKRTVMSELEARDPSGKEVRKRVNLISYRLK